MTDPTEVRIIVELRSYTDPAETLARVAEVIATHPTLSLRVDRVRLLDGAEWTAGGEEIAEAGEERRDTMTVDLRRACPLRVVDDIDDDDVRPGDVEVRGSTAAYGYAYACAGCGGRSWLAIREDDPGPRWVVTAGDWRRPETVSLSPSIFHAPTHGGCGWHGYLICGIFEPC